MPTARSSVGVKLRVVAATPAASRRPSAAPKVWASPVARTTARSPVQLRVAPSQASLGGWPGASAREIGASGAAPLGTSYETARR